MRLFYGIIFMGNANTHDTSLICPMTRDDYLNNHPEAMLSNTAQQVEMLRIRLEQGLTYLSGIQQGDDHNNLEAELENIVRDIAAALLGKEILIRAELPYPPSPPNLSGIDYDDITNVIFNISPIESL